MADIKKKEAITIKKFDRAKNCTAKIKENFIQIKSKANYNNSNDEENTTNSYGGNVIQEESKIAFYKGTDRFNKYGKKATQKTAENIKNTTQKIKKRVADKSIKKAEKITKGTIKNTKRTIKTAQKTGKVAYKTAKNTAKATVKTTKKVVQVAKTTVKTIKAGAKATITAIKGIIAGAKAIITALLAGGWVAVLVVVIICMIAMICSSVFGIFFSNEKSTTNGKTMSSVITEINKDFTNKITDIQKNNAHDDYEINSHRTQWKDVLSVYAVLVTNGDEQSDVMILDDKKIQKLKDIFWEMNEISSNVKEEKREIEIIEDDGTTKKQEEKRKILYIDIKGKTVEEMIEKYHFNNEQKEQLAEIRKEEYNKMWSEVLYGSSAGSSDIVQVAFAQIGNVGGQPYWSWYGYKNRVEWCACFVSWCANECGYIDAGIIPKFSACESEGVVWFKTCGLWQDGGYIPKSRRYYIF